MLLDAIIDYINLLVGRDPGYKIKAWANTNCLQFEPDGRAFKRGCSNSRLVVCQGTDNVKLICSPAE